MLKLFLLGPPRIELAGETVIIKRNKAVALLIYLAITAERQRRDTLAALLWPDSTQSQARSSLRRELSTLNKALAGDWLEIERETIGLRPDFWLDVTQFQRHLVGCLDNAPACLKPLTAAAELYRDHFLTGFTLPDCPDFDEWQFFQTESLRQSFASALERLVAILSDQGDYERALSHARRHLVLDPLHEPAQRALMRLYAQTGQQAAALRQYQLCLQTLNDELGAAPAAETTALYEQIRTGAFGQAEEGAGSDKAAGPILRLAGRFELGDPGDSSDSNETRIGQGNMGIVYRGRDTQTGEPVAIKRLKPEIVAADPTVIERFVREGEALRRLNHPNIVKMLAATEVDGHHYLVMEYVGGRSLRQLLQEQPQLPLKRALAIGLELADALTRAHHLNIIHRDLKPDNVLLTEEGLPRLADFGIAHLGDQSRLTEVGTVLGTLAYLSPEACNGEPLDARTDIWSFGVLLYEMLAGRLPFQGEHPGAVLTAILSQPPPDLKQYRADLPASLGDLIDHMLVKDHHQRLASVRLVGAALEALVQGAESPLSQGQPQDDDAPTASPAPSPVDPPTVAHNLPPQPTSFVGRAEELAQIRHRLQDPHCRLLTLLGPGGIGKTRLALQTAQTFLAEPAGANLFSHSITFIPLGPAQFPHGPGQRHRRRPWTSISTAIWPPQQQLLDYLREGKRPYSSSTTLSMC